MLEVLFNVICGYLLALLGYYIIKVITKSNTKLTISKHFILLLNSILVISVHFFNYSFLSPIINFIINTITYKLVFDISFEESLLVTGLLSLFVLISDIISVILQSLLFLSVDIQNNPLLYCLSALSVILLAYLIFKIPFVYKRMQKYYKTLVKKDLHLNIVFLVLLIITASGVIYKISTYSKFNIMFVTDTLIILSVVLVGILYINNRNTYNKLSSEYDILLESVKNFETWVEQEKFNRHEYKNQLAVVYSLSKEKAVKKKIEDIINQNLEIESNVVQAFKDLPSGGLKGILYYKAIIAEKNKVKLTTDISITNKGKLAKLNQKKINELAKIIGIFLDNAIEAAVESRKKTILLEIYDLNRETNIVISNSLNKNMVIKNDFIKGHSSKGKDRGNGLYFAKKIIDKNNWLSERHEIIDNYYIETIRINKNTSKK